MLSSALLVAALLAGAAASTALILERRRTRSRPAPQPDYRDVLAIVGEAHVLSASSCACFHDRSDCVAVVDEILAITGGAVPELLCSCVERGARRKLILRSGRRTFTGELDGRCGHFEPEPLLELLNRAFDAFGAPGRLYEFEDSRHSSSTGIVYALPPQAALLRQKGLLTKPFFVNAEDVPEPRCKPGSRVRFHPNARLASAILAEDYVVGGRRCARGTELRLNPHGGIERAVLARSSTFDRITFPAGSVAEFHPSDDANPPISTLTLSLPCRIADLELPEQSRVEFDTDGCLKGAIVGRDMLVGHAPCPEGTFIAFHEGVFQHRAAAPYRG